MSNLAVRFTVRRHFAESLGETESVGLEKCLVSLARARIHSRTWRELLWAFFNGASGGPGRRVRAADNGAHRLDKRLVTAVEATAEGIEGGLSEEARWRVAVHVGTNYVGTG